MPAESESGAPVERAAPTRVERTVSRIKEDFKNVERGSRRFQAFADYADRVHAKSLMDNTDPENRNFRLWQMQYSSIMETIRQRTNGIKGCRKEYAGAEQFGKDLTSAMEESRKNGEYVSDFEVYLGNIKNTKINESGQ